MKLSRIVLLSLLFSYSSQVVPSMPETHVMVAAIGGVFGGIGIKSTYDYFQREDASQKACQESSDAFEKISPKYSNTRAVLARVSPVNNEERFIVQLFGDGNKNVDTYFDELGKDIYVLKKVCRSTLYAFETETNGKKKEELKIECARLKKLTGQLSPFYMTWSSRRTEINYILFERSLKNDLLVYPYGRPASDTLYPVKSRHSDLKRKQAQLVNYKDMLEIDGKNNILHQQSIQYLSDLAHRVNQLEQSREYKMDCQRFSEIEPGRELAKMDQKIKIAEVRVAEERNNRLNGLENIIKREIQELKQTNKNVEKFNYTTKRSVDRIQDYSKIIMRSGEPITQAATKLVATANTIYQINNVVQSIKQRTESIDNQTKQINRNVDDLKSVKITSSAKNSSSASNKYPPEPSAPPADDAAVVTSNIYPELGGSSNVYD